jgi:hypothetical protein
MPNPPGNEIVGPLTTNIRIMFFLPSKTKFCKVRKRYKKINKKCDYLVKDNFMEFEKKYQDSLKKIYQINVAKLFEC